MYISCTNFNIRRRLLQDESLCVVLTPIRRHRMFIDFLECYTRHYLSNASEPGYLAQNDRRKNEI